MGRSFGKILKKACSLILATSMIVSGTPMDAFAATEPKRFDELILDENYISDGMFYLGSVEGEMSEAGDEYLLKVARYGNAETAGSVRVTMLDITASYGKDYKVSIYKGGLFEEKVQGSDEAQSVLEYIQENTGEEYNYSDAVADGSITAADQLDESEIEEQMEKIRSELVEEADTATPSDAERVETEEVVENEAISEIETDVSTVVDVADVVESDDEIISIETASLEDGPVINDVSTPSTAEKAASSTEDDEKESVLFGSGPLSLSRAKELATGLKDDKKPMTSSESYLTGFEAVDDIVDPKEAYMTESIDEVTGELKSAYIIINFEAGETEKYLRIKTIDNDLGEGTKQTGFNLSAEEGSAVSETYAKFTLFINDDEDVIPPTVAFSDTHYYPNKGYVEVVVRRTDNSTAIATVMLDTEGETAQAGRDFSEVSAKLIFGYGIDERTIKIPVRSTYLEGDATFRVKLGNPVNCVVGENDVALCTIRPDDEVYEYAESGAFLGSGIEESDDVTFLGTSDINLASVICDSKWDLGERMYNARTYSSSSYSRLEGSEWKMHASKSLSDTNAEVGFCFSESHYDYSGWQIKWTREAGKPTYGWTKVSYYARRSDENTWVDLYNKGTERWDNDTDHYFASDAKLWELWFTLRKNCGFAGHDPTLTIHSIAPIKRIFKVKLAESAPFKLIDENGRYTDNTSITGHSKDNATVLVGADSSGVLYTVTGNSISVKLGYPQADTCYIYGIELVDEQGKAVTVKSGYPENTTSAAFELDNSLLKKYSSYVTYKENPGHGLYGEFTVRAILKQKPATLKVKYDERAGIFLWDGNGGTRALPSLAGGYYTYTYNVGDCIGFDVTMKTGNYRCSQLQFDTVNPVIRDENVCVDLKENACKRALKASVTEVQGRFAKSDNKVIVRVNNTGIQRFDLTRGIFTNPYRLNGAYRDYIIDEESTSINGKQYVLSAYTTDGFYIPLWKESFSSDIRYSQEDFYFTGRDLPDDNIITLSTSVYAADYFICGSAFYEDVVLGHGTSAAAWLPAEGTYVSVGGKYSGITDENGTFKTMSFKGDQYNYVRVRISNGSYDQYQNIRLSMDDRQTGLDGKEAYALTVDNINVSSISRHSPHVRSVLVEHIKNSVPYYRDDILISDETSPQLMNLKAVVSLLDEDTGNPYSYSYTLGRSETSEGRVFTATETPIRVDFVVYDPITHKKKAVIEAKNSTVTDNGATMTFSVMQSFKHGEYNQYKAGDVIYAEVVTDRKQTNDETIIFQDTIYAPVGTGYAFVDQNPQQPDPVNIEFPDPHFVSLPIIGELTAIVHFKGISFGISETDKGGVRIYFGKAFYGKGNYFDSYGKPVSDTGFAIGTDNFKEGLDEMTDFIKSLGKKNMLGKMSVGVPVWSFVPIAGVYFEFAIYHDEQAVVTDQLVFAGGGGYAGCIGNFRYTYYMVVAGVPVYVGGDFNVVLVGEFGVAPDESRQISFNDPSQSFFDQLIKNSHFEFVFRAIMSVNGYAGFGICGTLGFRGGVSFTFNYMLNPTIKKLNSSLRVSGLNITGQIKFWADAVLLTIPIPVYTFVNANFGYFDDLKKYREKHVTSLLGSGAEEEETSFMSEMSDGMEIGDKPRNEAVSEFVDGYLEPADGLLGSTYTEFDTKTIINNSYDDTQQKLIKTDDGHVLMVFLDDIKERSDRERTGLKYSVYDIAADSWTAPVLIQNDGTADFSPDLCDVGSDILISWVSRNEPVSVTSTDYADYLRSEEIYCVRYSKGTGTLSGIERITDDSCYDTSPKAVYDDETGDIILMYLKAELTDEIRNAAELVSASMPQTNKSEIVYMLYDGATGEWVRDRFFANELSDPSKEAELLDAFHGQRFIASRIDDFNVNNPVISEFDVENTSYIALTQTEIDSKINSLGFTELGILKAGSNVDDDTETRVRDYLDGMAAEISEYGSYIESNRDKGAVYAFIVDEDNSLDEKDDSHSDSELFIQIYDYSNHKFSKPVRITDNDTSESDPQFVTTGGHTYLFWLDDGKTVKYTDIGDLLWSDGTNYVIPQINEADVKKTVVYGDEKVPEGTSINKYTVFADNGNLMIAWQEAAGCAQEINELNAGEDISFCQNVYVSGLFVDDTLTGGSIDNSGGYAWSNGIRMTSNDKLNELPQFAGIGNEMLLMVNNQYSFISSGKNYSITNSQLVETRFKTTGSVEIADVQVDTVPTRENPVFTACITLENTGIKANSGFDYYGTLLNGGHDTGQDFEGTLMEPMAPGGRYTFEQTFDMSSVFNGDLKNMQIGISVRENGTTDDFPQLSFFKLFENRMNLRLEDITAVQDEDEIVITGMVANTGCFGTEGGEQILVWAGGNRKLSYTPVVLSPIEDHMHQSFEIRIRITDDLMRYGFEELGLQAVNAEGSGCSEMANVTACLSYPYGISVNGMEKGSTIKLKKGQTLELTGTYLGDSYYKGGTMKYSSSDISIAVINGSKLTGTTAGSTELYAYVYPYGGLAKFNVVVTEETSRDDDDDDNSESSSAVMNYGPAGALRITGTEWEKQPDGTWKHLQNGKYVTGWRYTLSVSTRTYYHFRDDGTMDTGWYKDTDGSWYYLSEAKDASEGAMMRGWILDGSDGRWYYLNPADGRMMTGWVRWNMKWYYLSPVSEGPAWVQDEGGKWIYMNSKRSLGSMYFSEQTPDGYTVLADGAWDGKNNN